MADRPLEDANDRLVDAEHVAARPASGNAIGGEIGACTLHAWVRVGDSGPLVIRCDAQIDVVDY
jgi:hypothetical protein